MIKGRSDDKMAEITVKIPEDIKDIIADTGEAIYVLGDFGDVVSYVA